MFHKIIIFIFLLSIGVCRVVFAHDLDDINSLFNEVKDTTTKNRDFWGIDLYGPILLVTPEGRKVFANVSEPSNYLDENGQIFVGQLPDDINIANTCVNWEGENWAMVILPLPENKPERINLLAHELFHCSQAKLGFSAHNPSNSHLDEKEARILFRLELEALKEAIASKSDSEKEMHLTSAFKFRRYRQDIFSNAKNEENLLELNEGIAEYTGAMMSTRDSNQLKEHLINSLSSFSSNPSFVRSFAYVTIPAYGYLLSGSNKHWHKEILSDSNLIDYLQNAFLIQLTLKENNLPNELSNRYNGIAIYKEENLRDDKIKKIKEAYTDKFVRSSHLKISFENMKISFDPRNIVPLGDYGTVYPNLRISDTWGILTVENGALLAVSWDNVSISKPMKITAKGAVGDGWTLELEEGYSISFDKQKNNYNLLKM